MKNVFVCPHCGEDITEYVRETEKNRKKLKRGENIKQWVAENHDQVVSNMNRARSMRTQETFQRQAETLKKTNVMRAVRFAELLQQAKDEGKNITPDVEESLMQEAKRQIKKERRKQ